MRKPLIVLLATTVILGGCGGIRESRLNPFNWFDGPVTAEPVGPDAVVATDGRQLVSQVTSLNFDNYHGGVIVRATGLPPSQGWWKADLVPRPLDENGVLVFEFRLSAPMAQTATGTPRSREITAAASVSDYKLETITRIVVQGASNALGANR